MMTSTNQIPLAFDPPSFPGANRNKTKRAYRKRERELAKHPRSPSLLALNARDITPSGKGWIRMRHGDHFSQWCKGMLCVKLRTVVERDAIVHRVEVICGHATVERRQGAVLKAFGLSGAECTHQETGSAKFRFEVA